MSKIVKVKVLSVFRDKNFKMKTRVVDDQYETSEERGKELQKKGFVEILADTKEKEEVEVKHEKKEITKP